MPIKLKRSAVADKVPTTDQLELGELAVNTPTGRLFTRIDNGTPAIVEYSRVGHDHDTANFTGGTLDGVTIGATTPGAGTFTDLTGTGALTGFAGRLIGIRVFKTPGSGYYAKTSGTKFVVGHMLGGGGGGGDADADVSLDEAAAGTGGGAGAEVWFKQDVSARGTVYYDIGSGGAGGSTAGANGSAGTNSVWDTDGNQVIAEGGTAGFGNQDSVNVVFSLQSGNRSYTNTAASVLLDVPGVGSTHGLSIPSKAVTGSGAASGSRGGSSSLGAGGGGARALNNDTANDGADAKGYGSGGGGGAAMGATAHAIGGNGSGGILILWEYSA